MTILPMEKEVSVSEQQKAFEQFLGFLIDEDFIQFNQRQIAENVARNLIVMKDQTLFKFDLFSDLSEKDGCAKFGLKKIKPETKDKLFEILSLILNEVVKFLRRDINDSILKNFNKEEKEFIKTANQKVEESLMTFIENVLQTYKVDSPVVSNALRLFMMFNFRDKTI